jgi:hypothetical protein
MIYEEEHIENLLRCEKEITGHPAKEYKEDRGHMKKNFTLSSLYGSFKFRAFIRFNMKFIENFSIGLDFDPSDEKGTICLLRCNGTHGDNMYIPHHNKFHIHRATAETINSGAKPESNIELTEEYATLEQAIQYFISFINLKMEDRIMHFPIKQPNLFE